jgi:hypothetical protein
MNEGFKLNFDRIVSLSLSLSLSYTRTRAHTLINFDGFKLNFGRVQPTFSLSTHNQNLSVGGKVTV